jgi:hypothetical protein
MMETLQNIFYPFHKIDATELSRLQSFMYSEILPPPPIIISPPTASPILSPEILYPTQQNSLFWSIYIAHYGIADYQTISKYAIRELQESQKIAEFIGSVEKSQWKTLNHKITQVEIQEMASNILLGINNELSSAFVYCLFYKKNIHITFGDYLYLEISTPLFTDVIPIHYNDMTSKYGFCREPRALPKFHLVSIKKPIKSLSSYTMNELKDMAQNLAITLPDTKLKKPEIYRMIESKVMRLIQN